MSAIERNDIQGNILEGYTFPHVQHLFASFHDAPRGRQALANLRPFVTSAVRWDAHSRPTSAINLGLSAAGLRALNVTEAVSDHGFPAAFWQGMRARAALLGDEPERYYEAPWHEPERVHLWLWMYASSERELDQLTKTVEQQLAGLATLLEPAVRGSALRNERGQAFEHFGFRDGLSGPAIAGSMAPARPGDGTLDPSGGWRPLATGEFVLGHVDEAGAVAALGASGLSRNGTFAVFRKLGQDVVGFRAYLADQAARFRAAGLSIDEEWLAARMVGRQKDGTPLVRDHIAHDSNADNAFTFSDDPDGRICPLGSHIRRGNPRASHGFASAFARHRIVRRSVPFGRPLEPGAKSNLTREQSLRERGLLFVALQADIERQFEFLQRQYMNDGAAARQGDDADPLVGSHSARGSDFVIPGDPAARRATLICPQIPRFVECLGGEYFFLPGLRALERLAGESVHVPNPQRAALAQVEVIEAVSAQTELAS